ncbi:uncharacterized protein [Dermacentor andersoni]|uniref:uncharacterized protein isoform X2 n=1 Tax=Dermacentor andersoni TaxID=34620 RepID=UPI0021556CEA|nr:uncharacterized protein LOC126537489 isoform X2 [Dermacentor andersoni]
MMRSLAVFPAASLLVLWAVAEIGLCNNVVPCPLHCSASVSILMPDGSLQTVNNERKEVLIRITNDFRNASGTGKLVIITIGNTKVRVPASLEVSLGIIAKKYPDLVQLLIKIIKYEMTIKQTKKVPPSSRLAVKPATTTKGTKRRPLKLIATTKRTARALPTKTKRRATTKRTARALPTKTKRRATTKRTARALPTKTKRRATTKRTARALPTKTKRRATTKRTARALPTKTKRRATTKRTARALPTKTKRRATTKRTARTVTAAIKRTETTKRTARLGPPKTTKNTPSTNKPRRVTSVPNMTMSNPGDLRNSITAGSGVDTRVFIMLGYMMSQPNYFAAIYRILLQLGITFPSLTGPIYSVTYRMHVIQLPRPFVVSYAFTLNNKLFNLPKESKQLAIYLSHHMDQFSAVATFLHQIGASFPVDSMGRITGFSIFNVMYRFPSAITTTISIESKRFVLPKDINLILAAVKNNPREFFRIQMVLEAFGVKFVKKGEGFAQAIYDNKKYNVNTVRGVTITIEKKQYNIPADLENIFEKAEGFSVGAMIAALQEKGVPIEVDEKTGVILGIIINRVKIPFPVSIDLRFQLDDKLYLIPRDLGKLVAVLEKKGMPSKILSILYTRYGVIPVRDSNGIVVAISFNGKQFKVKAEPLTAVVIRGQKFLLPRDTEKMVDFVHSQQKDKKIGFEFLKALKVAGFMLINDDDGAMRSIQKGAQIIKLGMEIRIRVTYGTTVYHVPKDLMRLVKDIRSSGPNEVRQVIQQLKAFDVEVKKERSKLTILFNSVRYVVDLKSGGVKG